MTNKEAIEELKKVDTLDMPARLCEAYYMSIKALEQEPSGDLISRQAVLEKQYRIDDSATLSTRDVVNVEDIEDLPSVNPQEPKWIPVSERLPEEYERVLVTIQTPHRTVVRSAEYLNPTFWIDNGDFWRNTDEEIKAWMPLPEPYKAESEDKE